MKGLEKSDFLIVGQGIAGSLLAHELIAAGQKVLVIDEDTELTSSHKAGGLYNPITGRQMVKTWLADELFPGLESYYARLEQKYDASFLHPKTIYRPFHNVEEQNDWQARASDPEYEQYIGEIVPGSLGIPGVQDAYGGLKLNYSGYVDLPCLMRVVRNFLETRGLYQREMFQHGELHVHQGGVSYKQIESKRIIFCEGTKATANPFWNYLPFKPVKGELMDIEANLPEDLIINRGVFILPRNGTFRVGSTYDHNNPDFIPSEQGIKSLQERLSKTYSGEYRIVGTSAGVRPATFDRKPFIGVHRDYKQVGIFNGFGTKGVSLVPYFAQQYVNYLLHNLGLHPEADVKRVKF